MSRWTVISIFDPTGGGADFAYTVGLAPFGDPELHVWARPDVGHDVGADYMLSTSDRMVLWNRLGDSLITGEISVGSVIEETFDGGLTEVAYTLGEPVHPDTVDAFQVEGDAEVIPGRWELHRPAIAEPTPTRPAAAVELGNLLGMTLGPPALDHRFGPASPLVADVDARLADGNPLDVLDVVGDLASVPRMLAWILGVTEAPWRDDEVAWLDADLGDIVDLEVGTPEDRDAGFRHPAVLVRAQRILNAEPSVVHVVPLSSTIRSFHCEIVVEPDEANGLGVTSAAQCQHIPAVSPAGSPAPAGTSGPPFWSRSARRSP